MAEDQSKPEKINIYHELGVTGLRRFGNEVAEEFLRELSGQTGIKVYTEMSQNDAMISSVLFTIKSFCRSVKWYMEPGGTSQGDEDVSEFVDSCRNDMSHSWQALISQILSAMLPYGFAYHELVYKQRLGQKQKDGAKRSKFDDGHIGWRKMPVRSASSLHGWKWAQDGSLEGMYQQGSPNYNITFIPLQKALLFRTDEDLDNPEGKSILRGAYKAWFFKTHIEEFEAIGVERDSVGMPIFWAPASITNPAAGDTSAIAARDAARKLVKGLKRDDQEGILMPLVYDKDGRKLYDLTLLSGQTRTPVNAEQIIQRYDTRIAQTALAEFIMLGVQRSGGSFALSEDKTDYFSLAVTALLDEIAEVFNSHAIPRLLALNPHKFDNFPQLKHSDVKRVDPNRLANVIRLLTGSGMKLTPELETWVLNALGMPEPKEGAESSKPEADDNVNAEVDETLEGAGPSLYKKYIKKSSNNKRTKAGQSPLGKSPVKKVKNTYPDDRLVFEDRQAAKLSKTFLDHVRQTVDDTSWDVIAALIAARAPASKILATIQFAEYAPHHTLEISYRMAMNVAAKYAEGGLGIDVHLDLLSMNPKATSWLEEFGASEVRHISQTQREAIQSILSQGYKEGWSYGAQGNYIKQFIGLDVNRAQILQNYGNSLMEQEVPEKKAWKLIEQRGQELLKERADGIALNETLQASQHGWVDTTTQMVQQGILDPDEYVGVWTAIADERTCDECVAASGSIRVLPDGVYEASGTEFTYLHPGDRCVEMIQKRSKE